MLTRRQASKGLTTTSSHTATSAGYQASKDDLAVYSALSTAPSTNYVNVTRWYDHISALLRLSGVTAEGEGVKVESSAVADASTPEVADQKVTAWLWWLMMTMMMSTCLERRLKRRRKQLKSMQQL